MKFNQAYIILVILMHLSSFTNCQSALPDNLPDAKNNHPENLDIYLLIGQSNMAGRAKIAGNDTDTLKNVFLYTGIPGKEWEKAARGPDGAAYPWGELLEWRNTNVAEHGLRDTQEVGMLETDKSGYGLYDVMGNVQEWTSDILKPYEGGTTKDVKAYNNKFVAVRGASYAIKGDSTLLWSRHAYLPSAQYGLGFRCARGGAAAEAAE